MAYKSLAYKSPAVKTPASASGHAHNISVSSHPSSTPLAANAIRDELLNLDSPAAALINSIASGQDGLGITSHPPGTPARDGQPTRSPEAEKLHRLQQAVNALRSKMVGRGVSREGVERVARVQGFEALWDEDNLTIAGNIVELDITFDSLHQDKVVDVTLKLNSADGESHIQQDATTVLKSEVGVDASPPDDLRELSANLQYLAQMDRISVAPNAFEVVGRLYETFRNIWEEEKKHMKTRHQTYHLCKGATGRPSIDRRPRLGITLDYWRDRHEDSGPAVVGEETVETSESYDTGLKKARIACASGDPQISASLKWLSSNVLDGAQPDNMLDADVLTVPDWLDPLASADNDTTTIDEDMNIEQSAPKMVKTLNAHFVCNLEPEVLVPLNTVLRLNEHQQLVQMDQEKVLSYSRALQTARDAILKGRQDDVVEPRWSRRLLARSGSTKVHSYALYPAGQGTELWFYPITQFIFSHPRQLAKVTPVLRQYSVLWALLRNLVVEPMPEAKIEAETTTNKRRVTKRSNAKSNKANRGDNSIPMQAGQDEMSIDFSLDVVSDLSECKLEVFAAIPGAPVLKKGAAFIHFSVVVIPNGSINVAELSGVPDSDTTNLRGKLSRMLSLTEDIGMVLEWLMDKATAKNETGL